MQIVPLGRNFPHTSRKTRWIQTMLKTLHKDLFTHVSHNRTCSPGWPGLLTLVICRSRNVARLPWSFFASSTRTQCMLNWSASRALAKRPAWLATAINNCCLVQIVICNFMILPFACSTVVSNLLNPHKWSHTRFPRSRGRRILYNPFVV